MLLGDLQEYVAIPRVTALRLAPDGSWLAAVVQNVGGEPPQYLSSIWRIDTAEDREPVRLTRSAAGEASPLFRSDGSLLFVSKRPDPEAGSKDAQASSDKPAVWLLPAAGGEAMRIAAPGGGVTGLAVAKREQAFVYAAAVFPGATDTEQDAARRKARADAGVSAILHEPGGRLRFWDHDLGPEAIRLLTPAGSELIDQQSGDDDDARAAREPRDLTPDPGQALDEQEFELAPDGSAVVTGWRVTEEGGWLRNEVVVIDAVTGQRRTLLGEPGIDFSSPRISPDGEQVLAIREEHDSYDRPGDSTLVLTALAVGPAAACRPASVTCSRASTGDRSRWPGRPTRARCTSPRTTTAAARSSGSAWTVPSRRECPPTTRRTTTSALLRTAVASTLFVPVSNRRRHPCGSLLRPSRASRRRSPVLAAASVCRERLPR